MANIYLDPFVLACPSPDSGPDDFEEYICTILSWRELSRVSWASMYITERAFEVLESTDCYPPWDNLREIIARYGISGVHLKDIIKVVNALLFKLPYIEKKLKLKEILFENPTITPNDHIIERSSVYIEQYQRMMALMHLVCFSQGITSINQILITKHLKEDQKLIEVSLEIVACEFEETSEGLELPFTVWDNFVSCKNTNGLNFSIDPILLWQKASCEETYYKAINIYIYQQLNQSEIRTAEEQLPNWVFGSKFLETAEELGFLNQEEKVRSLFRACTETILGTNLRDTHELRIGSGANDPQRTRSTDGAWRRDIDRQYHLHYWARAEGPELASVVVHNDMSIPN